MLIEPLHVTHEALKERVDVLARQGEGDTLECQRLSLFHTLLLCVDIERKAMVAAADNLTDQVMQFIHEAKMRRLEAAKLWDKLHGEHSELYALCAESHARKGKAYMKDSRKAYFANLDLEEKMIRRVFGEVS